MGCETPQNHARTLAGKRDRQHGAIFSVSLKAAEKRFKAFHGRTPKKGEIGTLSDGTPVFLVGQLDGVMYKAIGEDRSSLHRFNKNDRPLLFVSSDGRQLYTIMGSYRFTDRGFEG